MNKPFSSEIYFFIRQVIRSCWKSYAEYFHIIVLPHRKIQSQWVLYFRCPCYGNLIVKQKWFMTTILALKIVATLCWLLSYTEAIFTQILPDHFKNSHSELSYKLLLTRISREKKSFLNDDKVLADNRCTMKVKSTKV